MNRIPFSVVDTQGKFRPVSPTLEMPGGRRAGRVTTVATPAWSGRHQPTRRNQSRTRQTCAVHRWLLRPRSLLRRPQSGPGGRQTRRRGHRGVRKPGRALRAADVADVLAVPVIAELPLDARLASAVDAGGSSTRSTDSPPCGPSPDSSSGSRPLTWRPRRDPGLSRRAPNDGTGPDRRTAPLRPRPRNNRSTPTTNRTKAPEPKTPTNPEHQQPNPRPTTTTPKLNQVTEVLKNPKMKPTDYAASAFCGS